MTWLWIGVGIAADPWTQSCEERGREPWGTVVDVVDHEAAEQTEERFNHAVVHRPLRNERLNRAIRKTHPATEGLVLCRGDWVESWYGADVTLAEVGSRALLTLRGGSLVWLDAELRQVRGIVDYYVLDGADGVQRESPVPVSLGYSATTASRHDSAFRIEVLDPASGESLVLVSPEDTVFSEPSGRHGVTIVSPQGSPRRVHGGEAARLREGRVLSASEEERRQAIEALAEVKGDLDARARELWPAAPEAQGTGSSPEVDQILRVQGRAIPEEVWVDGARLEGLVWRPVRKGGHAGLQAIPRFRLGPDRHHIQVSTWGELHDASVSADPARRSGAVVAVERDALPRAASWAAHPSLLQPWIRGPLEARPSIGVSYAETTSYKDPIDIFTRGVATDVEVPVRANVHGGHLFFEVVPRFTVLVPDQVRLRADFIPLEGVEPPPPSPWFDGRALAGFAFGHRLRVEGAVGVALVPLVRNAPDRPATGQQGVRAQFFPAAKVEYGDRWTLGLDVYQAGRICLPGTGQVLCTTRWGATLRREAGRLSPFLRLTYEQHFTNVSVDPTDPAQVEKFQSGGWSSFGARLGAHWRLAPRVARPLRARAHRRDSKDR